MGHKCYEHLELMDDMSYSKLCTMGFGCYEHVTFVNKMNNSRSRYLIPSDAKNGLGLWMT